MQLTILDGGLATELERRGADLRDPLWSAKLLVEHPNLIREVHEDYLRAGADIVTTASYQASFESFARRSLDREQTAQLLRSSVRLAREAIERVGKPARVAASVGPYGAFLADGSEFRGDYGLSVKQLIDWHRPRFEVLAASGADLLACETIPCQAEAEALVRLLEEFPRLPAWFSFSCRDERSVWHGETLAQCVRVASARPRVWAVGVNCTAPHLVEELVLSIRDQTNKLLLAYPNAGGAWDTATRSFREMPAVDWRKLGRRWLAAGATILGGCCRTTPETIRLLRSLSSQ